MNKISENLKRNENIETVSQKFFVLIISYNIKKIVIIKSSIELNKNRDKHTNQIIIIKL